MCPQCHDTSYRGYCHTIYYCYHYCYKPFLICFLPSFIIFSLLFLSLSLYLSLSLSRSLPLSFSSPSLLYHCFVIRCIISILFLSISILLLSIDVEFYIILKRKCKNDHMIWREWNMKTTKVISATKLKTYQITIFKTIGIIIAIHNIA